MKLEPVHREKLGVAGPQPVEGGRVVVNTYELLSSSREEIAAGGIAGVIEVVV